MKKVHIATVGSTSENIIRGVRAIGYSGASEGIELYPIVSEKYLSSLEEIKRGLANEVSVHETIESTGTKLIVDPFHDDSYFEIIGLISDIVQEIHIEQKKAGMGYEVQVWVNITGGTSLMSAAASAGAILTKSTAYYVLENRASPIEIPWHSLSAESFHPVQQASLIALVGNSMYNEEIQMILSDKKRKNTYVPNVTKRKMTYHLQELSRAGYVTRQKKGRNVINFLTLNGKIAARFLEMSFNLKTLCAL